METQTSRAWWLCCLVILACAVGGVADAPPAPTPAWAHAPSTELLPHQQSARREVCRLRIVNDTGGLITGSLDAGQSWEMLGSVVIPALHVTDHGYTAAQWAPDGAVAATAVNSIHLCSGHDGQKAFLFSLCPKELISEEGKKLQSFAAKSAGIYTDIPGGTAIFGGAWSPAVGSPLGLERHGEVTPLPANYIPKKGDIYIIRVMMPLDTPRAIVFENRFSGIITEETWDGTSRPVGQVLKPVVGIGRFYGGQYAEAGALRANHSGVICISVSPRGQLGGFQILPKAHAMSAEMISARSLTQWMVIGPLDARAPSWEGVAPFYRDYLRPCWTPGSEHYYVDIRVKDGPWQPIPPMGLLADQTKPLPDWAWNALAHVTHIRINFPNPTPRSTAPQVPTVAATSSPAQSPGAASVQ
ncbi:MAG TPA: hypothetical protein PLZ36_10870 [Armatimonadota bacterium]|nr:hypothetical protein [Armatimonadota bacterium]